jgi:hypothetical protein
MERDRDGEAFQDDFTDNRGPGAREQEENAEKEVLDPDVDSQEGDLFVEKDLAARSPIEREPREGRK